MDDLDLDITWLGGACPVQAEGTINGAAFYFRARGEGWSLEVGDWYCARYYGPWPSAGYMSEAEAQSYIQVAARLYLSGTPSD